MRILGTRGDTVSKAKTGQSLGQVLTLDPSGFLYTSPRNLHHSQGSLKDPQIHSLEFPLLRKTFHHTSLLSKKPQIFSHTFCLTATPIKPRSWIFFSQDALTHNFWVTSHSDLKSKASESETKYSKILRFLICLLLYPSLQLWGGPS